MSRSADERTHQGRTDRTRLEALYLPRGHRISEEVYGQLTSGKTDQVRYSKRFLHRTDESSLPKCQSARRATRAAKATTSYLRCATLPKSAPWPTNSPTRRCTIRSRASPTEHCSMTASGNCNRDQFARKKYAPCCFSTLTTSSGQRRLRPLDWRPTARLIAHRFEDVTRASTPFAASAATSFCTWPRACLADQAAKIARTAPRRAQEPFTFEEVHIEQHASVGSWCGRRQRKYEQTSS